MSKECKTARNVVGLAVIMLIVILFWLVTTMILSSCGTWKWVEPMTPDSANNHRFNNKICK